MRRKYIVNIILFLIISFLGITVKAEINVADGNKYMIEKLANVSSPKITSVSYNKDLVTVRSTGSVVGYYYGVKPELNSAKYTPSRSNTFYASVKNGIYYFWVSGSGVTGGNVSPVMYAAGVKVDTSCSNLKMTGCTGSGVIERCFVFKNGSISADKTGDLVTAAPGYKLEKIEANTSNCANLSLMIGDQKLDQRYCKVTYAYSCVKDVPECTGCACDNSCAQIPYLTGLSVSSGVLTPSFNSGTYNYIVAVPGDVDKIEINASGSTGNAAGNIEGTGVKQLSIGTQTFPVRISNSAGATEYKIEVIRQEVKSKDNSLKSLGISVGTLVPDFNPNVTDYSVELEHDVETVDIAAELNDAKAKFADGYGPRTAELGEEGGPVQIRVVSEFGKQRTYVIHFNKKGIDVCEAERESKALLAGIEFQYQTEGDMPQLGEFSPNTTYYSDISIDNKYKGFTIVPIRDTNGLEDSVDIKVKKDNGIEEPELVNFDSNTFVPGVTEYVVVRVTSKECPSVTRDYTFEITLKEEDPGSSDATLAMLKVENHDIKFTKEKNDYKIKLKKNEKSVKIRYEPTNSEAVCNDNNEGSGNKPKTLTTRSTIVVTCTSQDGTNTIKYTITVDGIEKGANIFLIILLVIAILLVLIYLVLRLMGYRIIINGEVIGNFFRGIGEKIRGVFDK